MWFKLGGDARLGRCASDNCGGQPTWRLEADGVGSNYCSGCREKISPSDPPATGEVDDDDDKMVQIEKLISDMQSIKDRFGNTCVYIRRGGLSWGAVAMNRRDDDKKNGVFDLQAQHVRDMLARLEQIERLMKDRDEWRRKVWDAEKAITAQPVEAVPEGWQLVPIEPTLEQLQAGYKALKLFFPDYKEGHIGQYRVYEAMLAASIPVDGATRGTATCKESLQVQEWIAYADKLEALISKIAGASTDWLVNAHANEGPRLVAQRPSSLGWR